VHQEGESCLEEGGGFGACDLERGGFSFHGKTPKRQGTKPDMGKRGGLNWGEGKKRGPTHS